MARPVGASHGARDHWRVTFIAAASISTTAALSSRFTYSLPSPAATPNSGPPPRSIVPIARPDAGSITLAECASPLNVKIRRVAGSYRIASSSGATVVCPSTWSVVRSNIVTLLSAPEVDSSVTMFDLTTLHVLGHTTVEHRDAAVRSRGGEAVAGFVRERDPMGAIEPRDLRRDLPGARIDS